MTRNPFANFIYSFIGYSIFLGPTVAFILYMAVGMMHVEANTHGSEIFIAENGTGQTYAGAQGQGAGSGGTQSISMD